MVINKVLFCSVQFHINIYMCIFVPLFVFPFLLIPFVSVQSGFQVKSAYNLPPDWKENIPYSLDSIQRYCYQNHAQPKELEVPNTRYGSNRKKQLPASGTSMYFFMYIL